MKEGLKTAENKISNQIEAIKHFIETMDIEMVDAFLDSKLTYQDWKKNIFISKLDKAFKQFVSFGDTKLHSYPGRCNNCDKSKTGFTFVGDISKNYMSIIFDNADGKIKDLYECSDFKNAEINVVTKERIYIDDDVNFDSPF